MVGHREFCCFFNHVAKLATWLLGIGFEAQSQTWSFVASSVGYVGINSKTYAERMCALHRTYAARTGLFRLNGYGSLSLSHLLWALTTCKYHTNNHRKIFTTFMKNLKRKIDIVKYDNVQLENIILIYNHRKKYSSQHPRTTKRRAIPI